MLAPPDRRPFPRQLVVRADPASRAFYGWRFRGWAAESCIATVRLPGRSPTGPAWAGRLIGTRLIWSVPRQVVHGPLLDIAIEPRTAIIASAPLPITIDEASSAVPIPASPADRRIVVIAGQHPGEGAAIGLAAALRDTIPWATRVARIDVVPQVNPGGFQSGFTRDAPDGRDLNRCWHLPPASAAEAALLDLMFAADFVLDIHADEFASRPYVVPPVPCEPLPAGAVRRFERTLRERWPALGSRPRPPGEGEDHPGILVNRLAAAGVPGVMLELPMQLSVGMGRLRNTTEWQGRSGRAVVSAVHAALLAAARSIPAIA
ncbi:MAG: succinylglutamate desuccinylase/aspartoacylase family protein [Hyphomicrobiaceae bacterium]